MIAPIMLPSLYAGAAVFCASAIIWMFIRWHDKDIGPLPDEEGFVGSLTERDIAPGLYMWPNCKTRADYHGDEFKARWAKGPWGTITIYPRQPNFGRNLIGSLVIHIAVAFGIAVSIAMVLGGGESGDGAVLVNACSQLWVPVFVLGAVVYCLGGMCSDLFLGKPARFLMLTFLDGLILAAVQASVLGWMWPIAS